MEANKQLVRCGHDGALAHAEAGWNIFEAHDAP
jgi:hypothetical protein